MLLYNHEPRLRDVAVASGPQFRKKSTLDRTLDRRQESKKRVSRRGTPWDSLFTDRFEILSSRYYLYFMTLLLFAEKNMLYRTFVVSIGTYYSVKLIHNRSLRDCVLLLHPRNSRSRRLPRGSLTGLCIVSNDNVISIA